MGYRWRRRGFGRCEAQKLSLLILQRDDQFFEQSGALCGLRAIADSELVILVCLVFRRLFTEQSPDRFPEGEFGSGADCVTIGEAIFAQVIDLGAQFTQRRDAAVEFFNGVLFRSGALRFACFRSCHASCPSVEKSLYKRVMSGKKSLLISASREAGTGDADG